MRRAQRRLRQIMTVIAVAIFVAGAALAGFYGSSLSAVGSHVGGRTDAHVTVGQRNEPGGIRWRRTV